MLKCENCGAVLDETELVQRYDDEFGWYAECPECRCEYFHEVDLCKECGEWTDAEELLDHEGLCADCASALIRDMTEHIMTYTPAQQAYARTLVDTMVMK